MAARVHLPLFNEPPKAVSHADGKTWLREGNCGQCGVCCVTGNPVPHLGPGPVENACFYFRWEVEPTETEPGRGVCSDLTNDYRLSGCNSWPTKPEHIAPYKSCTYTFREWMPTPPPPKR